MIDLDSLYSTPQDVLLGIARRAKERRRKMKITQKELSRKSGVSYGSIRRFEETGQISLESLIAIAYVLDERKALEELFTRKYYRTMEEFLND